jgi:hypothetical protein
MPPDLLQRGLQAEDRRVVGVDRQRDMGRIAKPNPVRIYARYG